MDIDAEGAAMTADEKRRRVATVPFWFHSIDFGDGVASNGVKPLRVLHDEVTAMALTDLGGKSVLDVGAWDGFLSFAAQSRGARRVLALDHYVWSLDLQRQQRY